jgi:hypothetical protein
MGQIGRFIDKACAAHPALMRKVLDRSFGTLREWIHWDEEGEACGCLIGTMALCAGYDRHNDVGAATIWAARVIWPTAVAWSWEEDEAMRVGLGAYFLSLRLGFGAGCRRKVGDEATPEANALAVEMLKRRIARRLGVTYAVPAVGVQHA